MKVLIATGLYAPEIGGPATYTAFLERHLPPQGVECVVVPFTHVRTYPKILRHVIYLLTLLRNGKDVDCIYALDTVSVGVPACIASFILRKKFMVRVPGDYAWEQGQQRFGVTDTLDLYLSSHTHPFPVRVLATVQATVARRAKRVVVPSEYMKHVVTSWGIQPSKITRIYSALNPIVVNETKDTIRTKFGYSGFVVVTAARLTPWKGVEALIYSIQALHEQHTDVRLEILGDGILYTDLVNLVQKLGATDYIVLRGQVAKKELAERIFGADAFVLNTSYEGFSHQLLEVMEIGTPIITTSVGGNSELILDGKEGLIITWNNREEMSAALLRLYRDTSVGTSLVQQASLKVQQFREEIIIREIMDVFHTL